MDTQKTETTATRPTPPAAALKCRACGSKHGVTLWVPPVRDLGKTPETALAAIDSAATPYCWRCRQGLAGHGVRLFSIPGTRRRIAEIQAANAAWKAERAAKVAVEAERIRRMANGQAVCVSGRPVLSPTPVKTQGRNGKPLAGAAAAAVVSRALKAQPAFGEGRTRAERKAARRAAEKAAAAEKLATGQQAIATLVGVA